MTGRSRVRKGATVLMRKYLVAGAVVLGLVVSNDATADVNGNGAVLAFSTTDNWSGGEGFNGNNAYLITMGTVDAAETDANALGAMLTPNPLFALLGVGGEGGGEGEGEGQGDGQAEGGGEGGGEGEGRGDGQAEGGGEGEGEGRGDGQAEGEGVGEGEGEGEMPLAVGDLVFVVTNADSGVLVPGAVVEISGQPQPGFTDSQGVFTVRDLAVGTYAVTVTARDFIPNEREVEVIEDQIQIVSMALTPVVREVLCDLVDISILSPVDSRRIVVSPGRELVGLPVVVRITCADPESRDFTGTTLAVSLDGGDVTFISLESFPVTVFALGL